MMKFLDVMAHICEDMSMKRNHRRDLNFLQETREYTRMGDK